MILSVQRKTLKTRCCFLWFQVKPIQFIIHAIVTTSDLKFDFSEVDFGCCSIYYSVKKRIGLTNLSLLPQEFGFVGIPEVPDICNRKLFNSAVRKAIQKKLVYTNYSHMTLNLIEKGNDFRNYASMSQFSQVPQAVQAISRGSFQRMNHVCLVFNQLTVRDKHCFYGDHFQSTVQCCCDTSKTC